MFNKFKWLKENEMTPADRTLWQGLRDCVRSLYHNGGPPVWQSHGRNLYLPVRATLVDFPDFMAPVADYYKECLAKISSGEWKVSALFSNATPTDDLVCQLPHFSTDTSTMVAYWQDGAKCQAKRETRIRFGRWAAKNGITEPRLTDLQREFNIQSGLTDGLLRLAGNDDLETWESVYRSDNISSCMNNDEYGVTALDTWKCYPAAAHGLADNGLRLAWLPHPRTENPREAVARAIVHEPSMTYVRVYGDDNLGTLLQHSGYRKAEAYPEGLVLYTEYDDDSDGYIKPYVDGALGRADLETDDDNCFWVLYSSGDEDMQDPNGTSGRYHTCSCDHCGGDVDEDDTYMVLDRYGGEIRVCEYCNDNHYSYVLRRGGESEYRIPDSCTMSAVNSSGNYERFEIDDEYSQDYHNVHYSEYHGEYIFGDDVVYSETAEDYYFGEDAVQLSDLYDDSRGGDWYPEAHATVNYYGHWFRDEDCEDGVPLRGLSDEIDELLDEHEGAADEELAA